MTLRLANPFLIILIALVALLGCDRARRTVLDITPADATMDETMTDMEAIPVKLVWLVDYPEGKKDVYLEWVARRCTNTASPRRGQSDKILRQSRGSDTTSVC